jgi:hypothetical protein
LESANQPNIITSSNLTFYIWLLSKKEIESKENIQRIEKMQNHKINDIVDVFASVEPHQLSLFCKESGIKKVFDFKSKIRLTKNELIRQD